MTCSVIESNGVSRYWSSLACSSCGFLSVTLPPSCFSLHTLKSLYMSGSIALQSVWEKDIGPTCPALVLLSSSMARPHGTRHDCMCWINISLTGSVMMGYPVTSSVFAITKYKVCQVAHLTRHQGVGRYLHRMSDAKIALSLRYTILITLRRNSV